MRIIYQLGGEGGGGGGGGGCRKDMFINIRSSFPDLLKTKGIFISTDYSSVKANFDQSDC